jgi:hypothetical protein
MMTKAEKLRALVRSQDVVTGTLQWLRSLHPMASRSARIASLEEVETLLHVMICELAEEPEQPIDGQPWTPVESDARTMLDAAIDSFHGTDPK